jgi:hypothetical protein
MNKSRILNIVSIVIMFIITSIADFMVALLYVRSGHPQSIAALADDSLLALVELNATAGAFLLLTGAVILYSMNKIRMRVVGKIKTRMAS